MRANWVREKLRSSEPTYGCFVRLGSPMVAELLAHAGFDWLVIETEHNAVNVADIQQILMAMNGTETIPIVRVPPADPVAIQRSLDIGAMGILVPLIKTAADAEAVVRATRYPPHGTRSFGPLRASRYTLDNTDYLNRANDNILVAFIIETREAVENLAAIAAVPGVDALYLGPFDLGLALGVDPRTGLHPPVQAALTRMIDVCRANGIASGMGESTPEALAQWRERGCTMLGLGPDYNLLLNAARSGLRHLRDGQ